LKKNAHRKRERERSSQLVRSRKGKRARKEKEGIKGTKGKRKKSGEVLRHEMEKRKGAGYGFGLAYLRNKNFHGEMGFITKDSVVLHENKKLLGSSSFNQPCMLRKPTQKITNWGIRIYKYRVCRPFMRM